MSMREDRSTIWDLMDDYYMAFDRVKEIEEKIPSHGETYARDTLPQAEQRLDEAIAAVAEYVAKERMAEPVKVKPKPHKGKRKKKVRK